MIINCKKYSNKQRTNLYWKNLNILGTTLTMLMSFTLLSRVSLATTPIILAPLRRFHYTQVFFTSLWQGQWIWFFIGRIFYTDSILANIIIKPSLLTYLPVDSLYYKLTSPNSTYHSTSTTLTMIMPCYNVFASQSVMFYLTKFWVLFDLVLPKHYFIKVVNLAIINPYILMMIALKNCFPKFNWNIGDDEHPALVIDSNSHFYKKSWELIF